jgi:hypothetical protein
LLEEFLEDGDQGTVTTHEVDRVSPALAEVGEAEADESLSRPMDTGEKADDMLMLYAGLFHYGANLRGDSLDIVFGGFGVSYFSNVESRSQSKSRVDDGGGGRVSTLVPNGTIG